MNIDVVQVFHFFETYITPLLLVALFVLHVTGLFLARREHKERVEYMERMEVAARVYSREAYEFLILRLIQKSNTCVYCYWHSLHSINVSPRYQIINEQLIRVGQLTNDSHVRIITAKDRTRLSAAYELVSKGVEVRFHESLQGTDLRFTLLDDRWLIFGMPETALEVNAPSREGVDVEGRKLVALMKRFFVEQWETALDYNSYASKVVNTLLADSTHSVEMVSEQLRLPIDEVNKLRTIRDLTP